MARSLKKKQNISGVTQLNNVKEKPFRISLEVPLSNGYELKDMSPQDVIALHQFLVNTVYKKLTVSEVDKLFLRTKGMSSAPPLKYGDIELIHYGKDRNPFRIFGYYNHGYFVLCRIDGGHETHKQ